jgi:hypothetical protein
VDTKELEQEIQNAVRELQIQLPELMKSIHINVQIPEIKLNIPEIQVPEIHIPEIHIQAPLDLQIPKIEVPEIHIPAIRIESPRIDIETPETPQ